MAAINQLTEATEVSPSMQLPVYDSLNGQPRRVSVNQLQEYMQETLVSDTSTPFRLLQKTVADLNTNYPASSWEGAVVYCLNGNAGAKCLAVSDGANWKVVALGSTISAT